MTASVALKAPLALLPVVIFLGVLLLLDSYKLVAVRAVLLTIAAGAIAALASYFVNDALLASLAIELRTYSRYVAPFIEEFLKALVVVWLIRRHAIGFPVDAAIFGFATGTGFAVVENLYFLSVLENAHPFVWVVRGFGTAIMHGGACAIFAIIAHTTAEERQSHTPNVFLPGLAIAVIIHSVFNHFLALPVMSTIGILILLPPLFLFVFDRSEKSLKEWMAMDFDADAELLEMIGSGKLSDSRVGRYLETVRGRFKGEVVADLLCYLRLHTELSMRANGMLLMRKHGFEALPGDDEKAMLEELRYLEKSIGRTGQIAMQPFLRLSSRDLWQLYVLGK